MSCFMPVGHQVGDVLNTSLPRIRSFASSRVLSARSFSTSPFPFRKPATLGSCSIDNKCCNICWSEPCVTIFGSCLDCVTIEGEITWWAPRHALVGEEQRLFVPVFFFALSPPYALIETNTAERRLYIIILHSRYLLIFPPVLQQLSFKSTHVTYPFLVFIHVMRPDL